MPIYEYQCQECDRRSEALQRLNEPPLSECPHCGGPLRKLISAPAFQFKGSGWYVTDYARKGGGEAKEGAEGGDKAAAGESGGKSGGAAAEGGKEGGREGGREGGKEGGKEPGGKAAGAAKAGKASGSAD
jgi:putative FmdB family regulatory protein